MQSLAPAPLSTLDTSTGEPEIDHLLTLADCGLPVAQVVVVPAAAEEEFYRLNNLSLRLEALFRAVDVDDPDDDDIEDIAPAAQRLVSNHYLLDEFIDAFYESTSFLPEELRVRRPGSVGVESRRGRPSLLALKRAWCEEWTFASLWRRLSQEHVLLPAARRVLLHVAPLPGRLPASLERDAEALLGQPVALYGDSAGRITAIETIEQRSTSSSG